MKEIGSALTKVMETYIPRKNWTVKNATIMNFRSKLRMMLSKNVKIKMRHQMVMQNAQNTTSSLPLMQMKTHLLLLYKSLWRASTAFVHVSLIGVYITCTSVSCKAATAFVQVWSARISQHLYK